MSDLPNKPACGGDEEFCVNKKNGKLVGWNLRKDKYEGEKYLGKIGYYAKVICNKVMKKERGDPEELKIKYSKTRGRILSCLSLFAQKLGISNRQLFSVQTDSIKKLFYKKIKEAYFSSNPLKYCEFLSKLSDEDVEEMLISRGDISDFDFDEIDEEEGEPITASSPLRSQRDYGSWDVEEEKQRRLVEISKRVAAQIEEEEEPESGVKGNEMGVLETIYRILDDNDVAINEVQDGVYRCTFETDGRPKNNVVSIMKSVRKQLDEQEKYFNYVCDALTMTRTKVDYIHNKNLKALEFLMIFSPVLPKKEVSEKSLNAVFSGLRRFLIRKNIRTE